MHEILDYIVNKDISLFIYLNNLGSVHWDEFWLFVTNKFTSIPLYIILLFLAYKQFGLKKMMIVLLFALLLVAFSDQTANLFKYSFKRLRPCHNNDIASIIRIVKEGCGGLYGYFSGHAINSMGIAVFFGLLLKNKYKFLLTILIVWAVIIAYSRIYVGVHYPLDVLTGMLFGLVYGYIFYKLFTYFLRKINI
jgi:undecaprenyl-diphosphatase